MWERMTVGFTVGVLLLAGCATMTPEAWQQSELYWDAAKACESRYHTLHLDLIGQDGTVTMHADADSRGEYRPFIACYHEQIRVRVEQQRQAGRPVSEALNREPSVEVD